MKVTRFRRLGLTIGTKSIGWALLETTPPPESLPRISTSDPIAEALDRAARATKAGAQEIVLYRYTPETFGQAGAKRSGLRFHEHAVLLVKVYDALTEAGYTVIFEDA